MRFPSNHAILCGDGAPESKLDVPCVRSAEARVVVVEDDRRRLAEASDAAVGCTATSRMLFSLVSCLMCKVPRQAPSKQAVYTRESSRPQSLPRSLPGCPSDRAQSSTAAVLPFVVRHAGVARTESRSPCQADRRSSLNLAITPEHESERRQASYGSGDQWSGRHLSNGGV